MAFISYAQNNEDVLLNRVFGGQQVGFYVDIGAYHPVDGSVTKAFYDRGWSGINVEPGSVFEALTADRPRDVNLRMAVLDRKGEVAFFEDPKDGGMSHVFCAGDEVTSVSVPCDTLEAIIADHGMRRPVDFIKVDAEGAEAAIMRSTDWRRLRPRVLIIEATLPWSSVLENEEWEPGLLAAGYVRAYFDGINCFYVPEEEWTLLSRHFAVPVNVLDAVIARGGAFDAVTAEAERLREAHTLALLDATTFLTERDEARAELGRVRDQASAQLEHVVASRATIAAELERVFEDRAEIIAHRDALYADAMVRPPDVEPEPPPMVNEPPGAPPPQRRWPMLRRAARFGYGLVRPIARPIAWRLRAFALEPTMREIASLQGQLHRLEDAAGRVAPVRLPEPALAAPTGSMDSLARAMEQALIALSVTEGRRCSVPAIGSRLRTVALRLPGGRHADIAVGATDLSLGAALLASDGDWEPKVRHYLEAVVQPDWTCIDVGASLGIHTLSLASLASAGQVMAFEADPANFALLTHNIGMLPPPHGRVTPVQLALWDSLCSLTIGGADELAGCSFVSAETTDAARTEARLRAVVNPDAVAGTDLHVRLSRVPAMRLDDWVRQHGLTRLDMIKLDVEGAEANVIRGAHDTILRMRPILLVEYNPPCAAAYFDQSADALYVELEQRFASIYVLENDGTLSLLSAWDELKERLAAGKGYEDLVCLPATA